jgi:stage II sporulation protein D
MKRRTTVWLALLCFLLVIGAGVPVLFGEREPLSASGLDQRNIRVGVWTRQETRTVRVQALKGDWQVILHPIPPASASEPLLSEERRIDIKEGEDVALELAALGMLAKTSQAENLRGYFFKVEFKGGDLLNVESPHTAPTIFGGNLEIFLREKSLRFINTVFLEDYLLSVVSEVCPSSEPEAIRAMAIMARTFALHRQANPTHEDEPFEVCDDEHCLSFAGKSRDRDLVRLLIPMNRDEVMLNKGKLFLPYVHHTCGGKISSAKEVFEAPADDVHLARDDRFEGKGAENCFHSPVFNWIREFRKEEILAFLAVVYGGGASGVYFKWEPTKVDAAGRILEVKLFGRKERLLRGVEFIRDLNEFFGALAFRSMKFLIQHMRQNSIFRGVGSGSGVGMCLMGADGMAKKGADFRKILGYYYSNMTLSKGLPGVIQAENPASKKK